MANAIETTALTLEGQLWELGLQAQIAELAIPEATRPNNVQTTIDTENRTITVVFSAPANISVSATGGLVATPVSYLP